MKIIVFRDKSNENETIGTLSVDGVFVCYTLEDEYREKKVWGNTRIPAGRYHVSVNKEFGMNKKYFHRFPEFHRGMLHIENVPGFSAILIHIGNTDKDTAGCLLVGKNRYEAENGKFHLADSTGAYRELYQMVIDEAEKGNLHIEFIDGDR